MKYSGKDLIAWGYQPSSWFGKAIAATAGLNIEQAKQIAENIYQENKPGPSIPLDKSKPFFMNIDVEGEGDQQNIDSVVSHMQELTKIPTIKAAAIMPDACPVGGQLGTIPVGGVVAVKDAIHPNFHSADICCSMAISVFNEDIDPSLILDAGMKLSHFGKGGRQWTEEFHPSVYLLAEFEDNKFLNLLTKAAVDHHGTQGDGNHFFYVGHLESTGQVALVTHHGSRKPGAALFKKGMAVAEELTRKICPDAPKHNSWIPIETAEGQEYWKALQIIRKWTKSNHFSIHDAVAKFLNIKVRDRFWNEHNFVFERNGYFYHAKGATPAWEYFAQDSSGLTLIPMNMAEPILITRGLDAANGLGFAPHGAGRNYGRSAYIRSFGEMPIEEIVADQTKGIDARFYHGIPDVSELPGAYKSAAQVQRQIEKYKLADIVDRVIPYGSIMAGDLSGQEPWRNKKKKGRVDRPDDPTHYSYYLK